MTAAHWAASLLLISFPAVLGCVDGTGGETTESRGDSLASGSNIAWQTCGTAFQGECATISVPIDWAHPEGEKFDLAIGRVPALEPENRIGVLFLNPGGPGGSGIDAYITKKAFPDSSVLRKRFDLISWDPRGVKRSHPVVCNSDLLGQFPSSYPTTKQAYKDLLAYNDKLGKDCREHTGPLFDHVDTVSTVRDVDAIRAALGEEKINYLAWSYGTQVGQQYAETFPERIRAMTIDSNMDHSITSAFDYMRTATEDFEESFTDFVDWCARTPDCKLHDKDVRAVWQDMHAKAEAGTLIDPQSGTPLDADRLRGTVFSRMYNPAGWFLLADRLAALANGVASAAPKAATEELGTNSYQAIWCEDWKWRITSFEELDAYRRVLARLYPATRLAIFWSDVTACLGFPAKVNNPQHRLSISGTPTILMVTGRHDVGTPHEWNIDAQRQIRQSVLLHYDGTGHAQYFHSPCVRDHVDRYLTTLVTPPEDTHCEAEWPVSPALRSAEEYAAPTPRLPLHSRGR